MTHYKIAVIEDSPMLRDMLVELLQDIDNVEVIVTAAGEQKAVEKMASSHVNLAIIDLELEEGSGIGVIERLKRDPEKYGNPRAVVFSNYAISSMSRRCRELGIDSIFDKSFQLPELLSYVRDHSANLQ